MLGHGPVDVWGGPPRIGFAHLGHPPADSVVDDAARLTPGLLDGPVGIEGLEGASVHRRSLPARGPAQHGELVELLVGKGQPRSDLVIESGVLRGAVLRGAVLRGAVIRGAVSGGDALGGQAEGDVQERTRGRCHHLLGQPVELPQQVEGCLEVVGPDIAPVHHPGEQHLSGKAAGGSEEV